MSPAEYFRDIDPTTLVGTAGQLWSLLTPKSYVADVMDWIASEYDAVFDLDELKQWCLQKIDDIMCHVTVEDFESWDYSSARRFASVNHLWEGEDVDGAKIIGLLLEGEEYVVTFYFHMETFRVQCWDGE